MSSDKLAIFGEARTIRNVFQKYNPIGVEEVEAAIGIEKLEKLNDLVVGRRQIAERLTAGLKNLPGLRTPVVREQCTHGYYVYPMILDANLLGVSRGTVVQALVAEGISGVMEGYVNVHCLPAFQRKIAFGSNGFPWVSPFYRRAVNYSEGICPVAEKLHQ